MGFESGLSCALPFNSYGNVVAARMTAAVGLSRRERESR
jgi:hypothetical protein